MSQYPDVVPMLAYEDGCAAMDWLARACVEERARFTDSSGRLTHGEMQTGSGVLMFASPTPSYQSPTHHRENCAIADAWLQVPYIVDGVLVYVDNMISMRLKPARPARRFFRSPRVNRSWKTVSGRRLRGPSLDVHAERALAAGQAVSP